MKQSILLGILLSAFVSCTKYNQIDTGLAKAKFNGNMYEYFQSNSYDWDSLLVLIEYTGVKEYFTGEKEGYENITFFGPTNHSIRRKMFEKSHWNSNYTEKIYDYHSMREFVDGVGVEQCRTWILRHIVKGKYKVEDIPRGTSTDAASGITFESAAGSTFRVFSLQETYAGIPEAGAVVLYIVSTTSIDVASTDIQPNNGIVHSLAYGYTFGQL